MSELPTFRYHPAPLATGEIIPSENSCRCCGEQRGYLYGGPVYCVEPVRGEICPWCVADGSAAARYDAHFTDTIRAPTEVPEPVLTELLTRTPGFTAWQQHYWLYHCADAAAFLGRVGYPELEAVPEALEMVLHENDEFHWSAEQSERYVRSLDPDGDATGYLFRCLHCGRHLAYTDMS
ncbi:CbrC family protein [Kribbella qitaiheensis]|uniref:CbrC family protein n=1 Tax=Kribbella qitaiheensis TaxID=1544730 RepID=UPI00360DAE57